MAGVDTLAVASWGLLRTSGNKLASLAASWGLIEEAPAPSLVARAAGIIGAMLRRIIG